LRLPVHAKIHPQIPPSADSEPEEKTNLVWDKELFKKPCERYKRDLLGPEHGMFSHSIRHGLKDVHPPHSRSGKWGVTTF
jgi:hypothetical protein